MKLRKIIFYLLPAITLFLLIWEVKTAQELASLGHRVQKVNNQIESLREENETLAAQMASASALTTIEVQAKTLGFVEPTSNQFLSWHSPEFSVALPAGR